MRTLAHHERVYMVERRGNFGQLSPAEVLLIDALLAERDSLAAEVERLRRQVEDTRHAFAYCDICLRQNYDCQGHDE